MPIFINQLENGRMVANQLFGWANVVGGAGIKEVGLIFAKSIVGRVSIFNKMLYGVVFLSAAIVYTTVIFFAVKKADKYTKLALFWVFIPILFAWILSLFIPVLSYFRIIFILPGFYILVAKGLSFLKGFKINFVLSLMLVTSLIFLAMYYTNPKYQREDWRSAVASIDELAKNNGIILFENNNLPATYIYYSQNQTPAMGGLTNIPALKNSDVVDLRQNKKNIYLFEYLVDITDPQKLLSKNIEDLGYKLNQTFDFPGVGFVNLYTKPGTI